MDARTALGKGDHHLLMLGGLVGVVPGVPSGVAANATDAVEIEGTSDVTTDACRRLRGVAETYATKYNETIVAGPK